MDLLKGTLDMLVLRTLVFGPLHGYAIAKAIQNASDEALNIEFGFETGKLGNNRRVKVYRLTPTGKAIGRNKGPAPEI